MVRLAPEHIAAFNGLCPDARIVFLMRDPVDRAISSALMKARQDGRGELTIDGLTTFFAAAQLEEHPFYRTVLQNWQSAFGAGQVLPLFFDEFEILPESLVRRVSTFAGLDPDELAGVGLAPINAEVYRCSDEELRPLRRQLSESYLADLEWLSAAFQGPADL